MACRSVGTRHLLLCPGLLGILPCSGDENRYVMDESLAGVYHDRCGVPGRLWQDVCDGTCTEFCVYDDCGRIGVDAWAMDFLVVFQRVDCAGVEGEVVGVDLLWGTEAVEEAGGRVLCYLDALLSCLSFSASNSICHQQQQAIEKKNTNKKKTMQRYLFLVYLGRRASGV